MLSLNLAVKVVYDYMYSVFLEQNRKPTIRWRQVFINIFIDIYKFIDIYHLSFIDIYKYIYRYILI